MAVRERDEEWPRRQRWRDRHFVTKKSVGLMVAALIAAVLLVVLPVSSVLNPVSPDRNESAQAPAPVSSARSDPPPVGTRFLLQSVNFPDRYLGFPAGAGRLVPVQTDEDRDRATLVLVQGLDGQGFSMHLAAAPQRYVRGRLSYLWAEAKVPGDRSYTQDATFLIEPARGSEPGFAFRSINFPDSYIRHFDNQFYVESPTAHLGTPYDKDSAFRWVPA